MTARSIFQERLLPATLQNARRIPFYVEHWNSHSRVPAEAITSPLEAPTFTKIQYRESSLPYVVVGMPAVKVGHSTGTTGKPLLHLRGAAEVAAYSEYVAVAREASGGGVGSRSLLFSSLNAAAHGSAPGIGLADLHLQLDLSTTAGVERAIEKLTNADLMDHDSDMERHLCGSPSDLVCVTAALLESHGETGIARISKLISLTNQLTQTSRAMLERAWPDSTVVNRYSLSEISGGATEGPDGSWTFDPVVVPQVVALDDDSPVREGEIGELVLTELFPFSELQPFIRYRTGDIAKLIELDGEQGPRVELLGRRANNPIIATRDGERLLLSVARLRSRLESLPSVARFGEGWLAGGGLPYGSIVVSGQPDSLTIAVSTVPTFSQWLFPDAAAQLKRTVGDLVREEVESAGSGIYVSQIQVTLTHPGTQAPLMNSRPGVWRDQADPRSAVASASATSGIGS